MIKKVLYGILGAIIVLQFFRGEEPEVAQPGSNDLIVVEQVSGDVADILKTACYDCHSMQTKYPWYTYVTPVSWFVFDHVEHGRGELNFSEWATYEKRRKIRKLKEVGEEVQENKMPLESYLYMHGEADLTSEQRDLLINWAKGLSERIMTSE